MVDGLNNTRWAVEGDDEWILLELNTDVPLKELNIQWFAPERNYRFAVEVSSDRTIWTEIKSKSGSLSENTLGTIRPVPGKAQKFEFDVPNGFQDGMSLFVKPKKGRASLCGVVLEKWGP